MTFNSFISQLVVLTNNIDVLAHLVPGWAPIKIYNIVFKTIFAIVQAFWFKGFIRARDLLTSQK